MLCKVKVAVECETRRPIYRVLLNGCCKRHSTHDATLNFEPTFGYINVGCIAPKVRSKFRLCQINAFIKSHFAKLVMCVCSASMDACVGGLWWSRKRRHIHLYIQSGIFYHNYNIKIIIIHYTLHYYYMIILQ